MEKLLSLTINTQGFETVVKNQGTNKSKTYRGLKSQINHNNRTEKMDDNYLVRPENTKDNQHLLVKDLDNTILSWIEEMEQDYFNHYKRKMPKNVKPFINGLITFSETMQEDLEKFGADKMTKTILEFLKQEYGVKVISLDLHLDETTPHFHFQVLNYDFDKHKTHSRILETRLRDKGNEERRNITQDNLASYLQGHIEGFDYKRGKVSGIKQYHNKKKAQQEHLEKQKTQIAELEKKVSALNKDLTEKEKKILSLQEENDELEQIKEENDEMLKDYIEIINEIIEELYEIKEKEESLTFLQKSLRYIKNENIGKFEALVKKMRRKVKAVKKKSGRTM